MKEDMIERVILLGICLVVVAFAYAVLATVTPAEGAVPEVHVETERRPSKCAEFYNSGTHEWKECMGVGLRP